MKLTRNPEVIGYSFRFINRERERERKKSAQLYASIYDDLMKVNKHKIL